MKQRHIAPWRNSGVGVMSSVRGSGGNTVPLAKAPGEGTGYLPLGECGCCGGTHHSDMPCPCLGLPKAQTLRSYLLCPLPPHSQGALPPPAQPEKTSSFQISTERVDLCGCL